MNNSSNLLPENVSNSFNIVVNYFTDKIAEKISNIHSNVGMQNGYKAVQLASSKIAENIQPKSETEQQLEDSRQEAIKGGNKKTIKNNRKKNKINKNSSIKINYK